MPKSPLEVTMLTGCGAAGCPAVFATNRETFVVRGNLLNIAEAPGVTLNVGESAVEVPLDLLLRLAASLSPNHAP